MSFVKTLEEIEKMRKKTFDFYSAEMLIVFWETKPRIIERLLPPPLKPAKRPIVNAFIANYPKTNFSLPYFESAIFIRAEFNGEEGNYCLAMHVTNDMALAGGREWFGYPKKIANIQLNRTGKDVEGWSERLETRYLEVRAKLSGKFNNPETPKILVEIGMVPSKMKNAIVVCYNYKHFNAPEMCGFDYNPRLIREEIEFRPKSMEMGEAEVTLKSSIHDPWGEIEIVKVLGALYLVGDNSMLPGSAVAEVDQDKFEPYAFLKWDRY
jgi:acetoacetate decarboxylase